MKSFLYIPLLCVLMFVLTGCREEPFDFSPPPPSCGWRYANENYFYNHLWVNQQCVNLLPSIIELPHSHPWSLYEACSFAEYSNLNFELVWQTVGTVCQEGTENAPKVVIHHVDEFSSNGNFGSYFKISDNDFVEHELIIQMGYFFDQMTNSYGVLLWEKVYPNASPARYSLDITAQFVPIDGDRPIYVNNDFEIF